MPAESKHKETFSEESKTTNCNIILAYLTDTSQQIIQLYFSTQFLYKKNIFKKYSKLFLNQILKSNC